MTEQLISFETAKLAKEKGFNEREHWFYKVKSENDIELYGCTKKQLVGRKGYAPIYHKVHDYHTNKEKYNAKLYRCSAPTQSLLQKWLREKYKLHIYLFPLDNNKWGFENNSISINLDHIFINYMYEGKEYNSYEEALEFALLGALKLINNEG